MTGMGKNIGTIIDAISGSEGKNTIERLTKNPALEKFNLSSQGTYASTRDASQLGLDQYIKDYISGNKTATANTGQEVAAIDRFYNGDVERQLAELRTRQAQTGQDSLARSLAYMTRSGNLDRLGGAGGGSSYDRQMGLKTGADLNLSTLMQQLAQERADQDYMRQSQLGLAGRRTSMWDANAARALVPGQAMKSELGWNLGTIGDLLRNDQANNMYGVKYNPSAGEQFAEWQGNDANDIAQIASIASSVYGGGGGGAAPAASAAPNGGVTWNTGVSPYAAPAVPYSSAIPSSGYMYGSAPSNYQIPAMGQMYPSMAGGWGAAPASTGGWSLMGGG